MPLGFDKKGLQLVGAEGQAAELPPLGVGTEERVLLSELHPWPHFPTVHTRSQVAGGSPPPPPAMGGSFSR